MTSERQRQSDPLRDVSQIRSLRRQVRRTQRRMQFARAARLAIQGLGALALWTILLFLGDWAFQPSWLWRLAILLISAAAAAVWIYRRAPSIGVSLMEAAEQIELTHPELREAVINAIQLDDACREGASVGSAELASAFLEQTERHADLANPSSVVPLQALRKPALRSSAFLLAALILLGIHPAATRLFLLRVLALRTPGTTIVNVQPGDAKCVEGHAITFAGEARGVIPSSGRIRLTYDDQNVEVIPLAPEEAIFSSMPAVLQDTATYQCEIGQAVSRAYRIRVIRYPQIEVTLIATPPSYSGLPAETTAGAQAKCMAGSRVRILVDGSKDLRDVSLRPDEGRIAFDQLSPRRFATDISLDADIAGMLAVVDVDDLAVSESLRLEAIADSPPVAILNRGLPELTVLTSSSVEVAYEAHDDVGLSGLRINGLADGGEVTLAETTIAKERTKSGRVSLDLSERLQSPGDRLFVYASATDNSPAAQVGRSDLVTIRLVSIEESRQIVAERRKQTAEQVADVGRLAAQARDLADEQRWAEALEAQERCSSQLAALQDDAGESWARQRDLPSDLSVSFEHQRFVEQLDAATESSRQTAQAIRDSMNQPSLEPTQPNSSDHAALIGESQQRLERQLGTARAFADPQGASQALRDQVQDLVQHAREREPLNESASTQEAGERAKFWEQRRRQVERLKEDLQQAKERGLTAASPWVSDVDESLNASDLDQTMTQAQQSLRQMDIAKAQQEERELDKQLAQLEEQLDSEQIAEQPHSADAASAVTSDADSVPDLWQQAQQAEQLLGDTSQLRERQEALRRQLAEQPEPNELQQSNWQADQQQVAQAAEAIAQQASSMESTAASNLNKAAQAAAQAQQALAQGQQEQAMTQQAASADQMDAATGKLAADLGKSLEDCEQEAQAAEDAARRMRQAISQLQQQQANESGTEAAASQIAQQCEQLAEQCDQAGAGQLAQQLRDAAQANRRSGQPSGQPSAGASQAGPPSGQPGSQAGTQSGSGQSGPPSGQSGSPSGTAQAGPPGTGPAGSPAQQAAQNLSSALQAAGQMQSQAAETKAAAAEAIDRHAQQQQIARMAAQQQAASASTPVDAARQESLARQARELARQVNQPEASDRLQQAAAAAEAAAQAMKGGDPPSAQNSQSLSAQRLRDAGRALARPGNLGLHAGTDQDDPSVAESTLLIDVPPEMRQQIKALFDSQKPHSYADQLLEYSTKLRIDASSEGIAP